MNAAALRQPLVDARARRRRHRTALVLLGAGLLACMLASLGIGQLAIPVGEVLSILLARITGEVGPGDEVRAAVVWSIRMPRVLLGALVGATLAVSGAALQGLFRNPLADPTLLGVSSGAALAVALGMVFGGVLLAQLSALGAALALPLIALCGGLAAVTLVWRLATRHGRTSVVTMLLAGIAINALCGAGIGLCVYAADDDQLRDLTFWMLGSLGGATWPTVTAALPLCAIALVALPGLATSLNALLLGESEARHLGVQVDRAKRWIVGTTTLAVGAAVSVSGVIGFVGLVVPHIVRLVLGSDHRVLVPASALLGALVLVGADIVARTIVAPADLPIGIVTALVGSPVFLWLLVGRAREVAA